MAQGQTHAPGWVIADVAPAAIAKAHKTGQVSNLARWTEQNDRIKTVTCVPIG